MVRGKRGTPEKEIEETAERIRKRPESLKSARTDKTWFNFLYDIGVKESTFAHEKGQDFWLKVKDKVAEDIETYTGTRRVQKRDAKGHFTSEFTDEVYTYVIYRSAITKKWIGYEVV